MGTKRQQETIGVLTLVGSQDNDISNINVRILIRDKDDNILLCSCPAASISTSDGHAGYAVGCMMVDETNGIIYTNRGSITSADFDALTQTD